jgi:hypothetical protein
MILPRPPEVDYAEQSFVEENIHQAVRDTGDHKGKGTYHKQRFLQSDVIVVV